MDRAGHTTICVRTVPMFNPYTEQKAMGSKVLTYL